MIRTLISASVLAVGLVAAFAQSDPIAQRKELMTLNGKGFYGDINRMVRGQASYDQAKVNAAFDQIILSAKTLPTLYPDNAKPGAKTSAPPEDKYSASPKVWENKADFFDAKPITIPFAISVFPDELYQAPRSWAERAYPNNLIYFHEVDKGGHFAAWEQPELFAAEMRAAFRSLR